MKYLVFSLLAIGLVNFATAQEAPQSAEQTPQVFRRVDVITLAVPSALVTKQLMEDGSVTAERLIEHWKAGEAELLQLHSVNAGSQTESIAETTMMHRLFKGMRNSGRSGGPEFADYDQCEAGTTLRAIITAEPNGERPEINLEVTAQYIITVEPPKEDTTTDIYYSTVSVRYGANIRLSTDRYTLLGSSHQSPDKKTTLFLLARLGKPDVD